MPLVNTRANLKQKVVYYKINLKRTMTYEEKDFASGDFVDENENPGEEGGEEGLVEEESPEEEGEEEIE